MTQELDHNDLLKIEGRLKQASHALNEIAPEVAKARQVKEYNSEMRRNALAKHMKEWIMADMPSTKAESMARAKPEYLSEIAVLAEQLMEAEQIISKHQALMTSWETGRSLLSFSKESLRKFQG